MSSPTPRTRPRRLTHIPLYTLFALGFFCHSRARSDNSHYQPHRGSPRTCRLLLWQYSFEFSTHLHTYHLLGGKAVGNNVHPLLLLLFALPAHRPGSLSFSSSSYPRSRTKLPTPSSTIPSPPSLPPASESHGFHHGTAPHGQRPGFLLARQRGAVHGQRQLL